MHCLHLVMLGPDFVTLSRASCLHRLAQSTRFQGPEPRIPETGTLNSADCSRAENQMGLHAETGFKLHKGPPTHRENRTLVCLGFSGLPVLAQNPLEMEHPGQGAVWEDASHPTNIGIVEAEPFSICRTPDVGTVVTVVSIPHVGDHSEELIVPSTLKDTRIKGPHDASSSGPLLPRASLPGTGAPRAPEDQL